MTPAGFPHSDISGSTSARDSPKLFAACHVLHRLLAPRHPPRALYSLTTPQQLTHGQMQEAVSIIPRTDAGMDRETFIYRQKLILPMSRSSLCKVPDPKVRGAGLAGPVPAIRWSVASFERRTRIRGSVVRGS